MRMSNDIWKMVFIRDHRIHACIERLNVDLRQTNKGLLAGFGIRIVGVVEGFVFFVNRW